MADLDSLNIRISANATSATKAIDELKKSLGTLSDAMDRYLDDKSAVKGLNNLADGLNRVTEAIARLDTKKMKEISSAMYSMARAATNMDKAGKAMSDAERAVNKAAKKSASELATNWQVPRSALKDLNKAVLDVYQNVGDPTAFNNAKKNLQDLIHQYANFGMVLEDQKELLREIDAINRSGTKVHIPVNAKTEAGDDYNRLRASLGKAFTTGQGTLDIDAFIDNMSAGAKAALRISENTQDNFMNLARTVENVRRQINGIRFADLSPSDQTYQNKWLAAEINDIASAAKKLEGANGAANTVQNISNATQNLGNNANVFDVMSDGLRNIASVTLNPELGTAISGVTGAVSKLGTPTGEKGIQNMYRIEDAVNSLKGIVVPNISEDLARLAAGIAKLGGKKAETAAYSLPFIADGLKQLTTIQVPDTANLSTLAESIAKFGYSKVEKAVVNLPKLTDEIVNLINAVKSTGNVSSNVVQLTQNLAQLAQNAGRINNVGSRLPKIFTSVGNSAKRSKTHVFSLASAIGKIYATYWLLFRIASKIKKAVDISSQLTEVQNVVDNVFQNMTGAANNFAKSAINDLGMSELMAKQMSSRFQAMGSAMAISAKQVAKASDFLRDKLRDDATLYERNAKSTAEMSLNITRLAADMASFYNVDYEEVADDLASIYTGMSRPLRRYGLDLTENTLREYAMKNGLDANIKSMTQAQKTMLRYQYVLANTTAAQGDFIRTQKTWANQVRILKQNFIQLGSIIGSAFIQSLKPMVMSFNNAFNTILDLAEKTLNALGKLLGWQIEMNDVGVTFDDATDGMEDFGDAADDAADAQEKLNSNLAAFDKLNVITTKKDSGDENGNGNGAGGANGKATGGGVRIIPYESDIDSWYDFGKRIAEKIADALWNIDWDKIKEGAKNAAHNLAEFINGFIDTDEFWTGIGHTIAEALNTALIYADTLLTDINWKKLGQQIGNLINQAVGDFDWKLLGKTIADGINAASNFVYGLATTINASDIAIGITDAINEAFKNWDAAKTAEALNALVDRLEEFIASALGNLDYKVIFGKFVEFWNNLEGDTIIALIALVTWKKLGTRIGQLIAAKLNEFITPIVINMPKIVINWAMWSPESFVGTLSPIVTYLDEALKQLMDTIFIPQVSNRISNALGLGILGAAAGSFAGPIGVLVGAIFGAILGAFDDSEQAEKTAKAIEEAIHNVLNAVFAWDTVMSMLDDARANFEKGGAWILWGIIEGFMATLVFVTGPIFSFFETVWNTICSVFGISSPAESMKPLGEYIFMGVVEGFTSKFDEWTTAVQTWWDTYVAPWFTVAQWNSVFNNIWESLKGIWEALVSWWDTSITDWWDNNVSPWFVYSDWFTLFESIKNALKDIWDSTVGQWITDISSWWNINVAPWFTYRKWADMLSSIPAAFYNTFKGVTNTVISWMNQILESIENLVNGAIDKLNELIEAAKNVPVLGDLASGLESIGHINIEEINHLANGGYPAPGLFIAGEAGPELVGTIGGKTAVVNNDQIVSAVSAGVAKAVASVLGSGNGNQELVVNLDGREVFRSVISHDRQFRQSTGHSAFDY